MIATRAGTDKEVPSVSAMTTRSITISFTLLLSMALLLEPVSAGNTLTVSGIVSSRTGINADFTASPTSGPAPLAVQFTDSSIGTITRWSWEYRLNGSSWKQFAVRQNPSYTFTSEGLYDIRLTVSGPGGSDAKLKYGYITVHSPARRPVARFTEDRNIGTAPLLVHFIDRSLYNPVAYLWQFGDGISSMEKDPSHSYPTPGVYLVRLRVSNNAGSDTAAGLVVVLPGWWR